MRGPLAVVLSAMLLLSASVGAVALGAGPALGQQGQQGQSAEAVCSAEGLEPIGKLETGEFQSLSEGDSRTLGETVVTFTNLQTKDGVEIVGFDFESTTPVGFVRVKGGGGPDAANTYTPDGTTGEGLLAPENNGNQQSAVSNVVFCAGDGQSDDGMPDDGTPDDGTPDDGTPDDGTPDDEVDTDDLQLVAICTDGEDDLAKFRVDNTGDVAATVTYDVYGTDQEGELTLDAGETKYVTVEANDDGSATARLFYENEEIDVKASNTQERCDLGDDGEDITLTAICTDGEDGLSQFRVTNDNDAPVTVEYQKYGSDVTGELTVEANSETFFTVPTNEEGATTVTLDYEGEQVDVKASNPNDCDLGEENDGDDGTDDGDADDGDDGTDDGMDDGDDGMNDGDDGMNDGDDGMEGEMDAFQIDVAAGDVIETLGDDENDFYGTQGRLLQAQTVLENGTVTGSYNVPTETVTTELDGCAVTYTPVSYDGETGEVTLSVSVEGDADCEGVTLTLAGYELPGDDTTFVRENADGQELVAYETVELGAGDSGTVTIDLTDDTDAEN
jgi:hypothetical protein